MHDTGTIFCGYIISGYDTECIAIFGLCIRQELFVLNTEKFLSFEAFQNLVWDLFPSSLISIEISLSIKVLSYQFLSNKYLDLIAGILIVGVQQLITDLFTHG